MFLCAYSLSFASSDFFNAEKAFVNNLNFSVLTNLKSTFSVVLFLTKLATSAFVNSPFKIKSFKSTNISSIVSVDSEPYGQLNELTLFSGKICQNCKLFSCKKSTNLKLDSPKSPTPNLLIKLVTWHKMPNFFILY